MASTGGHAVTRRLHAKLTPPPDGPQARARGDVDAIDRDGRITVEVSFHQLAVPQDTEVELVCGDQQLVTVGVGSGSGTATQQLSRDEAGAIEDGAEVTLHHVDAATVGAGGVVAVGDDRSPLLHGVLRAVDEGGAA